MSDAIDSAKEEIIDAVNSLPENEKKKAQGIAKLTSLILLIVLSLVGIVGSFDAIGLNMASYKNFLSVFMWPVMVLLISIGVGTIVGKK